MCATRASSSPMLPPARTGSTCAPRCRASRLMLPRLSARHRRIVALAVFGLTLAAAYWLLLHSWFVGPLLDANRELAELERQRQHAGVLLAQRESLQRQVQQA